MTVGEGYHNCKESYIPASFDLHNVSCFYFFSKIIRTDHHVFPFDYSAAELSWTQDLNISTLFIDVCAKLGLAYNLKKVDDKIVKSRILRTGDKSLNEVYLENKSGAMRWISLMAMVYLFAIIPGAIYLLRVSLSG